MDEGIKLSIKDFRAIESAEIELKGITVVTGVNGCGKSTLSRFLYYAFQLSNGYEKLVEQELNSELSEILRFMDILQFDIFTFESDTNALELLESRKYHTTYQSFARTQFNISEKEQILSVIKGFRDEYTKILSIRKAETSQNRIKIILQKILSISDNNYNFKELTDKLLNHVEAIFDDASLKLNKRPIATFNERLKYLFKNPALPKDYNISEYGVIIIGGENKYISTFHSVQQIAYIDTPMMIGVEASDQACWNDLNNILKRKHNGSYSFKVNDIISEDILQGETQYTDSPFNEKFIYTRRDGAVFDLLECATGVKSFSILQLMIKNGFLTSNTLLMIDEPEAHLHPQWIVEYARLIVLLNKEIGVKFFIASHNPDMISALKYISEKEEISSSLNFYLAEKTNEGKETYIYKNLGTDIDPIFNSFNIALDRISQYGVSNSENDEIF